MSFRPVNQHRPATDQLTADLLATIEQHPMAFDVVVFPAIGDSKEDVSAEAMDDVVGSLESDERSLEYQSPFTTLALEPSNEIERYAMLGAGDGFGIQQPDGGSYRLLIKDGPVPKRSVVAYVVDTGQGLALRVMYVMRGDTIGRKAPAGNIYSLIPYIGGLQPLDGLTLPDEDPSLTTIIERLDDLLTITGKATSLEGPASDADEKIAALREEIDGLHYVYQSSEPALVHAVSHGLGSMFVMADVWTEAEDGTYQRDIVGVEETSPNRLTIRLSEPTNIKAIIKRGESF